MCATDRLDQRRAGFHGDAPFLGRIIVGAIALIGEAKSREPPWGLVAGIEVAMDMLNKIHMEEEVEVVRLKEGVQGIFGGAQPFPQVYLFLGSQICQIRFMAVQGKVDSAEGGLVIVEQERPKR